jgi:hypothetical protein
MELNDLKLLAAASLLSGKIHEISSDGGRTSHMTLPTRAEIESAVECAQKIWLEVLRQDRES